MTRGSVCVRIFNRYGNDLTASSGNNKKTSRVHTPGSYIYIPPLSPSGVVVVCPFKAAAL